LGHAWVDVSGEELAKSGRNVAAIEVSPSQAGAAVVPGGRCHGEGHACVGLPSAIVLTYDPDRYTGQRIDVAALRT
jgi:hypothetical protein